SALPQLFLHQRQVVAHKIQIEHSALTLAEKGDSVHVDVKVLNRGGRGVHREERQKNLSDLCVLCGSSLFCCKLARDETPPFAAPDARSAGAARLDSGSVRVRLQRAP